MQVMTNWLGIDAMVSSREILQALIKSRLLNPTNTLVYKLSRRGAAIAGSVIHPVAALSNTTIHKMLYELYFNPESASSFFRTLLARVRPDPVLNTFVLDRSSLNPQLAGEIYILGAMSVMKRVEDQFIIKTEFVDDFNFGLRHLREIDENGTLEDVDIRNKVGLFAEECAVEYERLRLSRNGFKELAPLVQRISDIDRSAGYDIISFSGNLDCPSEQLHIEVKGTTSDIPKFIWSHNEMKVARVLGPNYSIYVFTSIDLDGKKYSGPHIISDPNARLAGMGYLVEPVSLRVIKY